MSSASPARRYPTLDLLRLVAITVTMLAHTPSLVQRLPLVRAAARSLWLGVDLFMLISGWLLGGQLLREASRDGFKPLRFYAKRWMRTLPPYYAVLAVLYFLPSAPQFHGPLPLRTVLLHVTFLQQYIGVNFYMVSWSLCVEEHFYLLLPLLVMVILRAPRLSTVLGIVAAFGALALAARALTFSASADIPYQSHVRSDGLFLGMALAFVQQRRPALWALLGRRARAIGVVGVVASVAVMVTMPDVGSAWRYIAAPTVATWAIALAFLPCVHEASAWSRVSFPGLQYIGELTYSIYLTHDVLPRSWINAVGSASSARGALARLALVIACSVVLHHVVERPALRLRERLLRAWDARARRPALLVPGA
jgi:peptidoglycan/LPS O-acetylase OafA/YrhL